MRMGAETPCGRGFGTAFFNGDGGPCGGGGWRGIEALRTGIDFAVAVAGGLDERKFSAHFLQSQSSDFSFLPNGNFFIMDDCREDFFSLFAFSMPFSDAVCGIIARVV